MNIFRPPSTDVGAWRDRYWETYSSTIEIYKGVRDENTPVGGAKTML